MPTEDTVLCPDCGWTGPRTALDGSGPDASCPVCDAAIAVVD